MVMFWFSPHSSIICTLLLALDLRSSRNANICQLCTNVLQTPSLEEEVLYCIVLRIKDECFPTIFFKYIQTGTIKFII